MIFRWPSGKSSASSPKPEIEAVQPQSAWVKSSRSTWSVSPGSAPSTATGPVTWSTRSKSRVASDSVVESAVISPFEASRQSNSTTSPEPTLATGGMAGSQARWFCSRAIWTLGVGSDMGRIVSDAATDPRGLRCECMDADRVVVGIDNGATKNNATVLDASGRFLVDRMHEIPSRVAQGPEAAIEAMAETMDLVLRDTGTDRSRVVAVGLDTPGPASAVGVISTRGATNFAQPAWWGFDVRGALEAHIGLPVVYNNDGNAAALYAHHVHFGADAPMHSSVSAVVGTGLGGGVIEAGLVVRGAAGMAGELGHVQIFTDGLLADDQPMPTCACGNSGDVESLASLTGIVRNLLPYWLTRYPEHPLAALPIAQAAKEVRAYGVDGDEMALRLFDQQAAALGRLFTIAANYSDPSVYFVGGGVVEAAPHFRDWFLERVRAHTRLREEQAAVAGVRARSRPRHGRRPRIRAGSQGDAEGAVLPCAP